MAKLNLVLTVPQGTITATSLGIDGFTWHRSPGAGRFFQGRYVLIDLAIEGLKPAFRFLEEGGWRDAQADAAVALEAAAGGKRTKTGLSNNAFSCTPIDAYRRVFLVKTGGETLEMEAAGEIARFRDSNCHEGMSPEQIAACVGLPPQMARPPRLYMVLAPVEFIVLSSLTPTEYVWYATHRPGKVFRQVLFSELRADQVQLAAEIVYQTAREELGEKPHKKTKTVVTGGSINRVPYSAWVGYHRETPGGLYSGDQSKVQLWRFPETISRSWERAHD
ncbi:MAG: hypothetical protein HY901_27950 [Deltaproteobacteria bacterium]|nr:hypothetical protein [Deltaproteobacteria bacterium]